MLKKYFAAIAITLLLPVTFASEHIQSSRYTTLGHVDVQMVMRTYGKWVPDNNAITGYRPTHDWSSYIRDKPSVSPRAEKNDEEKNKNTIFQLVTDNKLASPRGFEPLLPP